MVAGSSFFGCCGLGGLVGIETVFCCSGGLGGLTTAVVVVGGAGLLICCGLGGLAG